MVFSLEYDIKVTKSYQNLLPTQTVIVAHMVLLYSLAFVQPVFLPTPLSIEDARLPAM
jgi:hypothetical protein